MGTQLDALMALLRRVMARVGWRLDQSGSGTQIGQVSGNVYVYQQPAPEPPPQPAPPAQPTVPDVMALLDALDAYEGKRRRVLEWAAAKVGTGYVKGMSELGLRRTYGYALATLENCRAEEDRRARLNDSYRKRSNGR